MNLALFCNLNFTEVSIGLKICYSLSELYVRSVYLNFSGGEVREFHETCCGGGGAL
jgi:hypothetical protein